VELPGDAESIGIDTLARKFRSRMLHPGTRRNSALSLFEREDGMIRLSSGSGMLIVDLMSHTHARSPPAGPTPARVDRLNATI